MKKDKFPFASSIFISILLITIFMVSSMQVDVEDISTYGTGANGSKAFFDLAQSFGYEVHHLTKPLQTVDLKHPVTLVLLRPDIFSISKIERQHIFESFLNEGNSIIFMPANAFDLSLFEVETPSIGRKRLIQLHPLANVPHFTREKGSYRNQDNQIQFESYFSNLGISDSRSGIDFIRALERAGNRSVFFGDYYQGISDERSFFDIIGVTGKLLIVQLLAGAFMLAFFYGKRFGRVRPVYENFKRQENEKMYVLANLFMKAKSYDHVYHTFYTEMMQDVAKYLGLPASKKDYSEIERLAKNDPALVQLGFTAMLDKTRSVFRKGQKPIQYMKAIRKMEEFRSKLK